MEEEKTIPFIIVQRDSSGQPIGIYPHDSDTAVCIVMAIEHSKGYFNVFRVREILRVHTEAHGLSEPSAWYQDSRPGYKSALDAKDRFFGSIFDHFCMLAVDPTINNPDCLGGQANGKWDDRFDPRNHCILLNASVRDKGSSLRPFYIINANRSIESQRYGCSL